MPAEYTHQIIAEKRFGGAAGRTAGAAFPIFPHIASERRAGMSFIFCVSSVQRAIIWANFYITAACMMFFSEFPFCGSGGGAGGAFVHRRLYHALCCGHCLSSVRLPE